MRKRLSVEKSRMSIETELRIYCFDSLMGPEKKFEDKVEKMLRVGDAEICDNLQLTTKCKLAAQQFP